MKPPISEIGFQSNGSTLPLAFLIDPERNDLLNIASAGVHPRHTRRALYSELVDAGLGFESIAFMSEHGPNALLPGGPYSIAPFSIYLNWGKEIVNTLYQRSGLTSLYNELGRKLRRVQAVPEIYCKFRTQDKSGEDEISRLDLPGIHPLPLPTPKEWSAFQGALAGLDRFLKRVDLRSTDKLKHGLALLLCQSGVPLKNLFRRLRNYRFGSFISTGEYPTYFAALNRQHDQGLGLILVALGQTAFPLQQILVELSQRYRCNTNLRRSLFSQRNALFSDFEFTKITFSKFLRQLLIETADEASGWSDRRLILMIDRCSTLLCWMKLGGFQAFSLRDQLIIPANYFEVTDLLNAEGVTDGDLIGTDACRWANPYVPSREELDRSLTDAAFFQLVGLEDHNKGRGRPRKLHARLKMENLEDIRKADDNALAKVIAFYKPWATSSFVRELVERLGSENGKSPKSRANNLIEIIYRNGWAHTGKECRFIPLDQLESMLDRVVKHELPDRIPNPVMRQRLEGIIFTIALTGMRLGEAMRMRHGDIVSIGNYVSMHIHGTKVARARRDVLLDVFRTGAFAESVHERWIGIIKKRCSTTAPGDLLFANPDEKEGAKRTSHLLRLVLDPAFERFRYCGGQVREDVRGGFGAYTLRHLAAIRMVQGAIDCDFALGNFHGALAEVAMSLGHGLPALLSSYVGTAVRTLRWP